jgi:RNA polymerase sigma-70 factor (ECF subfamily)
MKNASRADGAAGQFARSFAATRGADSADLRTRLMGVWERVRKERGDIDVSPETFARHLTSLVGGDAVEELYVADLYFALGCALGDPAALRAFNAELVPRARAAASKTSSDPEALRAVEDVLVQKLLVADGGQPPRIRTYAGRGPLASWVCAAAVRAAVDHTRAEKSRASLRPQLDDRVAADDPELVLIRERHSRDFTEAFETAFAKLEAADRNVLRLSVVEGLSIDRLATMFGAHRSTLARRLARIRQYLMEETRNILAERLSLAEPELASLMRAVRSHLQLSLTRLFAASRGSDGR